MRNELDKLFAKEMTRKEFLRYIGSAFLFAVGVGGLLKNLKLSSPGVAQMGYGSSPYGGGTKQ